MRRILTFMGVVLLAFPLVAQGAVKVRTKAGGFKWDFPAGKRRAKGFKAPVQAGPFTLGFNTQVEVDFESNSDWDFNSDIADGQANNGAPGGFGLKTPATSKMGESFQTEFRIGFDAVTGPLTTHITLEQSDGKIRDRTSENNSANIERAWGDVDLGWFNVRYGIELYAIDAAFQVYGDDDPMLAIYKNYGNMAWAVRYIKRREGDEELRGNALPKFTPGDNTSGAAKVGEGRSNDVDIVMVTVEVPFANPMGPGTLSVQPFYIFDSDKRFQLPGVRSGGADFDGTIIAHYIGANITGNIGPVKSTISGAYTFGTDDTGFNAISTATGLPIDDVDITAWELFAEFAYPVPNIPLTVSVGAFLASGDDDPFDDNASAFIGVSHNSEIFGGHDIWIDSSEDSGEITVALKSAAGATAGGPAVTLTADDDATLMGLSSFNNVAGPAGTHPTRLAGAALPTPGADAGGGASIDPFSLNNRSHPGIAITNIALKYKVLPNVSASADFQHIRLMKTEGFSPLTAGRSAAIGAAALTKGGSIDSVVGNQFGFHLAWKIAKYLVIDPHITVLIPGDAIDDLTGSDDTALSFKVGMRWNF